ncbi:MAG TPA: peptidylprolyl isomerase [Pyrinomonadaceae bacterium]|nr:peptidylprolyl isomerase [Pyrinomonadaceae bacterium]
MRPAKQILIAFFMLGAWGYASANAQTASKSPAPPKGTFTSITAQEIGVLLADVAKVNPMVIERMADDPEMKRSQIENLRQLLAFATEAQKIGLANQPHSRNELDNIRFEVIAVNYDRHINKGKAFGYITEASVAEYWGERPGSTLAPAVKAERKAKFEEFLATKIFLLKPTGENAGNVTEAEKAQARDFFAKINIYADEYAKRSAALPLSLRQKVDLQVKLQQAQFLARLYSEKLATEVVVSDAEIASYIRLHPELDTAAKREKAEKILARAKAGEDFAKLANEFSEDPGNKGQQDQPQGGLYKNVGKGVMVPPFEQAALALKPGQIAPGLVESDFGFHIIKLDRKDAAPAGTYDVRHILIGTAVSDPSNPSALPVPVREYARQQVASEKEQILIERIVVANKISVPDDFALPAAAVPKKVAPKAAAKPKPRRTRKRT